MSDEFNETGLPVSISFAANKSYMNQQPQEISFDNTEYAFAYKDNASLKKASFLFSTSLSSYACCIKCRISCC